MALSEALGNMRSNYRFHLSVDGARAARLGYLTLYYLFFVVLRWGDRHARALRLLKALGLSDAPATVRTPDGLTLDLDLHTAFDPLYSIVGERDYEREPGFAPAPGETVIDLGANLGVFATRAARLVGPGGRVVAVEPHPANFERLAANARRNGLTWVAPVNAAAGEAPGEAALFVHERGINHSLSLARASSRTLPVRVTTVDALVAELGLTRVDLIKLDIEGFVPQALRGARETLRRFHPRLAIERDEGAESEGLDALLAEHGYRRVDRACFTFAR